MKLRFAASDASADQSFTLDVVAPPNTTDFHTSKNEGHLHHAELANLAAMARSIFHQVGATEVAQPELTTLVNFNGTNGANPVAGLIADAHGDLFGTTGDGGANGGPIGFGTVFEITETAHGYSSTPTTLVNFNGANGVEPTQLLADAHGDLFGTTAVGGPGAVGTVFEIAKTAHGYATTPTTLVNFNGPNGNTPSFSLIADAHGDLFGTAQAGGQTVMARYSRSPRPPTAIPAPQPLWSTSPEASAWLGNKHTATVATRPA